MVKGQQQVLLRKMHNAAKDAAEQLGAERERTKSQAKKKREVKHEFQARQPPLDIPSTWRPLEELLSDDEDESELVGVLEEL